MKKIILSIIILGLALLLLMGFTSPNSVTLPVYLAVFLVIYLICIFILILILNLAYANLRYSKKLFISAILAFSPVLFLALGTLSSISVLDFVLVIGLPAIIAWYGLRAGFNN
jgi:hypothetical protein